MTDRVKSEIPCGTCGEPSVMAFLHSTGAASGACAEHAPRFTFTPAESITMGDVLDKAPKPVISWEAHDILRQAADAMEGPMVAVYRTAADRLASMLPPR